MKLEPCGREACAQIINGLKRKWQSLTDDEIWEINREIEFIECAEIIELARGVEAKLRDKNGF